MTMRKLTPEAEEREKLFRDIASRYKELAANPRNKSMEIAKSVIDEFGVSQYTVYKVIRMFGLYRSRINRTKLINYHAALVSEGMKPSKAVLAAASKFGCTREYVYQLLSMSRI